MSSNKQQSQRRGLFVDHFGTSDDIPDSSVPVGIATLKVDVDRISFFDKNPRRSPNERYEEIKESIRASGLDHPLPVSRRPTDPPGHYFIYKGGNTRLRALKELWAETKNPDFFNIRCEFHPYKSETDALISHFRENDLRDDMTFIDRALSMQELKTMLEADLGESLSQRKLESVLKQRGLSSANQGTISQLEYAANLYADMPNALKSGIGEPQIRKLRKLEKAARQVWQFHCNPEGSEQQFRTAVFLPALASSDSSSWTYDAAESKVKDKLLAVLPIGVNLGVVKSDFKKAMDGKELAVEPPPEPIPVHREPATVTPLTATRTLLQSAETPPPLIGSSEPDQLEPAYDPLDQYDLLGGGLDGDGVPHYASWQPSDNMRIENTGGDVREVIVEGSGRWLAKLKRLRQRNYEIALNLAAASPVPESSRSVIELDRGYGFFLTDAFGVEYMPELLAVVIGGEECHADKRRSANAQYMIAANVWWFLAGMCGLFPDRDEHWIGAPDEIKRTFISDGSYIGNEEYFPQIHPIITGTEYLRTFWLTLPSTYLDSVFEMIRNTVAIIELVQAHREETNDATPWEIVTNEYY